MTFSSSIALLIVALPQQPGKFVTEVVALDDFFGTWGQTGGSPTTAPLLHAITTLSCTLVMHEPSTRSRHALFPVPYSLLPAFLLQCLPEMVINTLTNPYSGTGDFDVEFLFRNKKANGLSVARGCY
jgi:hypothetical protein